VLTSYQGLSRNATLRPKNAVLDYILARQQQQLAHVIRSAECHGYYQSDQSRIESIATSILTCATSPVVSHRRSRNARIRRPMSGVHLHTLCLLEVHCSDACTGVSLIVRRSPSMMHKFGSTVIPQSKRLSVVAESLFLATSTVSHIEYTPKEYTLTETLCKVACTAPEVARSKAFL
jgi:hypothetical protein